MSGILSDVDIKKELNKNVIIFPYDEKNLGSCSYDITLDKHFYRFSKLKWYTLNPWSNASQYWEYEKARKPTSEEQFIYELKDNDLIFTLEKNELCSSYK